LRVILILGTPAGHPGKMCACLRRAQAASRYYKLKIVAVTNIKGGVGKTTTAVNLAYLAALGGRSTVLWDLDPQGAATYTLKCGPNERASAREKPTERLLRMSRPLAQQYGLLFLDSPPGISLLSENVLRAADLVIVPLLRMGSE
jgi:chromosome partitioning protein